MIIVCDTFDALFLRQMMKYISAFVACLYFIMRRLVSLWRNMLYVSFRGFNYLSSIKRLLLHFRINKIVCFRYVIPIQDADAFRQLSVLIESTGTANLL